MEYLVTLQNNFAQFNQELVFRSNSSILGQKKKNQRKARNKKRAHDRRCSESEASEAEDKKETDTKTSEENEATAGDNNDENDDVFDFIMCD